MQSELSLALVPHQNNKFYKASFSQSKIPFPTSSSDTEDEDQSPKRKAQSQLEQVIDDISSHKCPNGEYVFLGGSYRVAWNRVLNFYRRYRGAPFSEIDCVKIEVKYDIDDDLRASGIDKDLQDYEFMAFIATSHTSKELEGRKKTTRVTDPRKDTIDVYRIYLDRYENVCGVIKAT